METTIIISLTVLTFSVFFVIFFRNDIRKVFPRIKSIGKTGVSLSDSQTQSQEERAVPFDRQFDQYSRSPVQIEKEDQIKSELIQRAISSDEEKVKLLIRALATTIIQAECERISLLIFGSQLELLVAINSHGQGMKLQDIRNWYSESVKPIYPALSEYSFEDYVGFLHRQILTVIEGDAVKITEFGREFLQYLVRTGQTHRRAN